MMKMLFTKDQERMRANIKRMVQEKVIPRAREIDEKDEVPIDILKVLSETGIFSILVPEEFGGLGGGLTEFCIAMEEVAKGSATCASTILGQGVGSFILRSAGNEEQKIKYYPRLMKDG